MASPGTACIEPPLPPNITNLVPHYEPDTTVEFGAQVKYTCLDGYFFGRDKELHSVNVTCQDDATWYLSGDWETCYHPTERLCYDPPYPSYNGGEYDWREEHFRGGKTPYSTVVTYTCGLGRKLFSTIGQSETIVDSLALTCKWDWTCNPSAVIVYITSDLS